MKYFSLFSGIGGFEQGIIQAYEKTNRLHNSHRIDTSLGQNGTTEQLNLLQQGRRCDGEKGGGNIRGGDTISTNKKINELPTVGTKSEDSADFTSTTSQYRQRPLCVGYSEIDKYAVQIYQKHFNHTNYGDITKITAEDLPDFDLLCGGFPCQAFSIAGKRRGFEDTRGTLFFDIARILRAKQPRLLLLENVKGLLSHDEGRTFTTIIATLDELGYDLQWQVLNSKNFGVPQNRERVFIVGHLRGERRPQVFPIISEGGEGESKLNAQKDLMIRDGRDNRSCLRSGRTPELGVSGTSIRRLTPTECARLQGFPDNWHEGVSDTQAYKCYGNAVTVNIIQAIVERLFNEPNE